ncbi:MAG: NFACT family protein [Solirubrobacterales bacterium]
MPFDGLTVSKLIRELNDDLIGARIDKIYQPERDDLLLVIRRKKGASRLIISANPGWARMHLTETRQDNPQRPSALCMLLRKHLEGGKIIGFEQPGAERVVHLRIEALNDLLEWREKLLICEFTGKNANIMLVDPETGTILDGIRRYGSDVSSHREVLPGAPYVAPPPQHKLDPSNAAFEAFCDRFWQAPAEKGTANALFYAFEGFSPPTCRELCHLCGLNPELPAGECGEYELSRLFEICRQIQQDPDLDQPTVLIGTRGPVDVFPFHPVNSPGFGFKTFATVNDSLDAFFGARLNTIRLDSQKSNLLRNLKSKLEKTYRKRFNQEGDLAQANQNNVLRSWGELLTAYAHEVPRGAESVRLPNFDGDGDTVIELSPRLTAVENAQVYFKRYARSRRTREHMKRLLEETQQEADYLESVVTALDNAESLDVVEEIIDELEEQRLIAAHSKRGKTKQQRSEPRVYSSSDGFTIWVGRNNMQNDRLTLRQANKTALWLHSQGYPGAHVILDLPPRIRSIDQVPDASLEEAAILAAHFSKGSEAEKIPVDYTFRSNVKKPKGARPGMVVYDPYWTVYVNPHDPRLETLLASQPSGESI